MIIRDANFQDINTMVPLLEQLFAIEADFNFDPEIQARGLRLMLDGCGKHRTVKVACANGAVVGMCTAQTRISTAQGKMSAVVEDLIVDADSRGRGIGRKLLEAIEDWAAGRGIASLSLLADRNNSIGLGFYAAADWKSTDLICLTKAL